MATNAATRMSHTSARAATGIRVAFQLGAYVLGAVMLVAEGAVHLQQYISLFHGVSWIGPLFLANAAASVVVAMSLALGPRRQIAALAGAVISVLALGSLVISYGMGLFGWHEVGFRTPVAVALIAEVGAVISLAGGVTARATRRGA
jgi:hypothetical protein